MQKTLFCYYYLRTLDPDMAAKMAGYRQLPAGAPVRWLQNRTVERALRRMSRSGGALSAYQAAMRLAELAFGTPSDAVRLAWLPKETEPGDFDGLDLRQITHITRKADGSVELRLLDRVEALTRLMSFLNDQEREEADGLIDALDASIAAAPEAFGEERGDHA